MLQTCWPLVLTIRLQDDDPDFDDGSDASSHASSEDFEFDELNRDIDDDVFKPPEESYPPIWAKKQEAIAHSHLAEPTIPAIQPPVSGEVEGAPYGGKRRSRDRGLELITRMCHHCQMNATRPARLNSTLHDGCDFNYKVAADTMCFEHNKLVLQVVDSATSTRLRDSSIVSGSSPPLLDRVPRPIRLDRY